MPAINQRARMGGSGVTAFTFDNKIIGWAQQLSHQAARPVAAPAVIQPMDEPYPVQIMTPQALGPGSITFSRFERYKSKVWDDLGSRGLLDGAVDLRDVFVRIAELPAGSIGMTKIIKPPAVQGQDSSPYTEEYHGCVITDIADNEDIQIGTMEVLKQITVAYAYRTINGKKSKGA